MRAAFRVARSVLTIALLLAATRLALPLIGGDLVVSDLFRSADGILPLAGGQEWGC